MRITAILNESPLTVLHNRRASAAKTGVSGPPWLVHDGSLVPVGSAPVAKSLDTDRSVPYVSAVPLPNGLIRFYFEAARSDG